MTTIAITIVGRAINKFTIAIERAIGKRSKELISKIKKRRSRSINVQEQ